VGLILIPLVIEVTSYILLTLLLILCLTELRPHFSLASESDTADPEDLDVEDDHEEAPSNQTVRRPQAIIDDAVATSGVSTLSSTVSHDSQSAHRSLNVQLGRMKIETNRYVLSRGTFFFLTSTKEHSVLVYCEPLVYTTYKLCFLYPTHVNLT
jgi:hypothetical protein